MLIDLRSHIKALSVKSLLETLQLLEPEVLVSPNLVGNLNLYQDSKWIGYVDILDGELVMFDEPEPISFDQM